LKKIDTFLSKINKKNNLTQANYQSYRQDKKFKKKQKDQTLKDKIKIYIQIVNLANLPINRDNIHPILEIIKKIMKVKFKIGLEIHLYLMMKMIKTKIIKINKYRKLNKIFQNKNQR